MNRSSRAVSGWTLAGFALMLQHVMSLGASLGRADESEFRLFDGFEEKLELAWEPVRPDPTHMSLTRNPGKLTITTQNGTIGFDETSGGRVPAKNLYLIRNPASEGGDLVITACIESFKPTMNYQQAGLLVYDDDDNYLKCDMEWCNTAVRLKYMWETDQRRRLETDPAVTDNERIWIRIIKRGRFYERLYSTDGEEFTSSGEVTWGNGAPKWVGIVAKNGTTAADDIDACFDFFEARSLTDLEKSDPSYLDRQKMRGRWEVVSCQLSGKALKDASFSEFDFDDGRVTIKEKAESIETEYTLDATQEPKRLVLLGLSAQAAQPVNGSYSLEGDNLSICLAMKEGAPAPTELETKEGDSRLLITLRRGSDTAATGTNAVD